MVFSRIVQKGNTFFAIFARKFVATSCQKSTNLVTLHSRYQWWLLLLLAAQCCHISFQKEKKFVKRSFSFPDNPLRAKQSWDWRYKTILLFYLFYERIRPMSTLKHFPCDNFCNLRSILCSCQKPELFFYNLIWVNIYH